jgi:hypothetical protein
MDLFSSLAGTGVNHCGAVLELRVGCSQRVGIHGFLSLELLGRAVPYPGISGNVVFKRLILCQENEKCSSIAVS